MLSPSQQNPRALLRLGQALLQQGKVAEAEQALKQLLALQPDHPRALELLGAAALARRDGRSAVSLLSKAIQAGGGSVACYNNLGQALLLLNRLQDGVRQFEQALALDPDNRDAFLGIGKCLLQAGDYDRAGGAFLKALERDEHSYPALLGLVHSYYQLNNARTALRYCERAVALRPDDQALRLTQGQLLCDTGRPHEAIEILAPLFAEPRFRRQARDHYIKALFSAGRVERVLEVVDGLGPDEVDPALAASWRARALNVRGQSGEALRILEEVIAGGDNEATVWMQLQGLRSGGLTADEIGKVEREFHETPETSLERRGALAFILARYHETAGNLATQMEWLDVANASTGATRGYQRGVLENHCRMLREAFDADSLRRLAGAGDAGYRPVFILGLPRSGTTLLEQILGAHSELEPVGETDVSPWILSEESRALGLRGRAEVLTVLAPEHIRSMAALYREFMASLGFDSPCIVEKGVMNGFEAGLLYALFPDARFVQIRRHPLDVALGCYKQLFTHQDFSFDIGDIAHHMALYERMMDYWREQLSAPVHVVDYEALVSDQEGVTRRLLEALDLPWEEGCLNFRDAADRVSTASVNQVRQGLYSSAVGRWQRYGSLLDPFRRALEEEGLHLRPEEAGQAT